MFFTIVKKEILLNLVSFRFIISIALLFVLIVGSLQIMAVNYGRRLDDYSTAVQMHNDDLSKTNSRPQFEAFGVTKDPRPSLLGIFTIGLEQQMNRSFMVPGFAMSTKQQGGDNGRLLYAISKLAGIQPEGSKYSNPIFSLFQPPDFIYIVNIVLSLLAILFSFDCIAGEKENQTLKLMLTNSLPRDTVLISKWVGGTLSILIPFVLSFALGVLLVVARPNVAFAGGAAIRILILLGLSMVYIAVFFLIGMVFSTFSARASTALILSLFAWVFFVLVVPNVAPVISRMVVPLKPSGAIIRESERIQTEMEHDVWKKRDNKEEQREAREKMTEELPGKISAIEDQWLRGLDHQVKIAMNVSRISPSAAYVLAASSVSGTGVTDYYKLRDETLRYRSMLGDTRDKFLTDDNTKIIPGLYIKIVNDLVPAFQDRRLELSESINNSLTDMAILIVYVIVLFMIAFLKFLNYDVK
jgi:ABC-type transport system involved in multi-copper enzyme maturation permease subunit